MIMNKLSAEQHVREKNMEDRFKALQTYSKPSPYPLPIVPDRIPTLTSSLLLSRWTYCYQEPTSILRYGLSTF